MLLRKYLNIFNYIATVFISLTTYKIYKRSALIEGFRLEFLLCSAIILFSLLYLVNLYIKTGRLMPNFITTISIKGKLIIFIANIISVLIFYFCYLYAKELQYKDFFPISFMGLSTLILIWINKKVIGYICRLYNKI